MRGQTDDSWNPHARLEFFKVAFCFVFSLNISETRKVVNEEISKTDEELNQIEDFTITALSRQEIRLDKMNTSVERIENAATGLKTLEKISDTMVFVSTAKLFEYGEKSNNFFLNLIKSRQNHKLISKITKNENEFAGQDQNKLVNYKENFTHHNQ